MLLTERFIRAPLNLYKTVTVPLLAPTAKVHYTELTLNFEAIAYNRDSEYYVPITKLSATDKSEVISLLETDLTLPSRSIMTRPCHCWRAVAKTLKTSVPTM